MPIGPDKYKVVVAFDFSEQAVNALEQALDESELHGQTVMHVVIALEERHGLGKVLPGHKVDFETAGKVQESLHEFVTEKVGEKHLEGSVEFYVHARIGAAAREVLNLAAEADADLIVVGTHGRTGIQRWFLGSTAERIMRHAHCPVLISREKHYDHEDAPMIEPPCPDCVTARTESAGETWWCERHAKPYVPPHRYTYKRSRATTRSDDSQAGPLI